MRRLFRFLGILTTVGLMIAPFAMSTPELAKKESRSCTYLPYGGGQTGPSMTQASITKNTTCRSRVGTTKRNPDRASFPFFSILPIK